MYKSNRDRNLIGICICDIEINSLPNLTRDRKTTLGVWALAKLNRLELRTDFKIDVDQAWKIEILDFKIDVDHAWKIEILDFKIDVDQTWKMEILIFLHDDETTINFRAYFANQDELALLVPRSA